MMIGFPNRRRSAVGAGNCRAAIDNDCLAGDDVAKKDDLQILVDKTVEAWGRIEILVCNAAVNTHHGPLAEITEDALDSILDTNVKNALWLCNRVIPGMAERKDGAVIGVRFTPERGHPVGSR